MPERATRVCAVSIPLLFAMLGFAHGRAFAQTQTATHEPMRLERTIPLAGVKGRIDHLTYDADHERLFVAALGNNTVEAIDIKSGKLLRTISGLAEPQGVVYEPFRKHLWIANGGDGTVRIFDALTYQPLRSIALGDDADNVRLDAATHRVFVGYGSGAIAIFDSDGNKLADVPVGAHPESFQMEKNGRRMFVNVPRSQSVVVIDRDKSAVVGRWTIGSASSNFPMALDEAYKRIFIVCRNPALLLALDANSGAVVATLPTVGDSDDVFYDAARKRIYVSGGDGAIAVYQQQGADHYAKLLQFETVKGARTSLFVPELNRLFVAVRQEGGNTAAIRIYDAND